MNKACQDKFTLRRELVRYAATHGMRAAARRYEGSRNLVRKWHRCWMVGDAKLADRSRRLKNSPATIDARLAAQAVAEHKKASLFRSPPLGGHARAGGRQIAIP